VGERESTDLALFAHFVGRPEEELDLTRAALLLAEPEYPGLLIEQYVSTLDRMGEQVAALTTGMGLGQDSIERLLQFLYQTMRGTSSCAASWTRGSSSSIPLRGS
jgi:hypothetical protein